MRIALGILLAIHGLIHLLYSAHSARVFELQPGMTWPDGSWAFAGLLGNNPTRILAAVVCALAAAAFVAAAIGLFASLAWWRPLVIAAAAFSTVMLVLLWGGGMQDVSGKGLIAIIINVAILVSLLVFKWPRLGF